MNYALIKPRDIADGPGIRVALFVSGCTHHCPGCFNPETWDFDYGEAFTQETEEEILSLLGRGYIRGLTILGGEPFEPGNQRPLLELLKKVRDRYPEKSIWCYSGYTLETELLRGSASVPQITEDLLTQLDVLVDGEFHQAEKNPSLRFRGSANQRLIDMKKTMTAGCTVLWDESEEL